jgi:hypothetical protein
MDNMDVSIITITPEQQASIDEQIAQILLNTTKNIDNQQLAIMTIWESNSQDYTERYNKIVDEMCETYNSLIHVLQHATNVKVPFCWEHIRLSFANELHILLEEFTGLDMQVCSFMSEMHMHKNMSIERADSKLSQSSLDYLESVLGYYAHKSSCIKDDLNTLKKKGNEVFISSQQISSNCGEYM